jgi:hypothetical protein
MSLVSHLTSVLVVLHPLYRLKHLLYIIIVVECILLLYVINKILTFIP